MRGSITIKEIEPSDADWAQLLNGTVRLYRVVTRGLMHQADELPGLIAVYGGEPRALLTYSHKTDELEVVTLHAATRGQGLGSGDH